MASTRSSTLHGQPLVSKKRTLLCEDSAEFMTPEDGEDVGGSPLLTDLHRWESLGGSSPDLDSTCNTPPGDMGFSFPPPNLEWLDEQLMLLSSPSFASSPHATADRRQVMIEQGDTARSTSSKSPTPLAQDRYSTKADHTDHVRGWFFPSSASLLEEDSFSFNPSTPSSAQNSTSHLGMDIPFVSLSVVNLGSSSGTGVVAVRQLSFASPFSPLTFDSRPASPSLPPPLAEDVEGWADGDLDNSHLSHTSSLSVQVNGPNSDAEGVTFTGEDDAAPTSPSSLSSSSSVSCSSSMSAPSARSEEMPLTEVSHLPPAEGIVVHPSVQTLLGGLTPPLLRLPVIGDGRCSVASVLLAVGHIPDDHVKDGNDWRPFIDEKRRELGSFMGTRWTEQEWVDTVPQELRGDHTLFHPGSTVIKASSFIRCQQELCHGLPRLELDHCVFYVASKAYSIGIFILVVMIYGDQPPTVRCRHIGRGHADHIVIVHTVTRERGHYEVGQYNGERIFPGGHELVKRLYRLHPSLQSHEVYEEDVEQTRLDRLPLSTQLSNQLRDHAGNTRKSQAVLSSGARGDSNYRSSNSMMAPSTHHLSLGQENGKDSSSVSSTPSSTDVHPAAVVTVKEENTSQASSTTNKAARKHHHRSQPYSSTSVRSSASFPSKAARASRVQKQRRRPRSQKHPEVIDLTADSDEETHHPLPSQPSNFGSPPSRRVTASTSSSSNFSAPSSPPFSFTSWPHDARPPSSRDASTPTSSLPSSPASSLGGGRSSDDGSDDSSPPLELAQLDMAFPGAPSPITASDGSTPSNGESDGPLYTCRHECGCEVSVYTPFALRETSSDGCKKLLTWTSLRRHERNLDLHRSCPGEGTCADVARSRRPRSVKRQKIEH